MAQRRMFSKDITTSDTFVDMPTSSQLLYFHLGMEADDEGFIGNARMLSRAYGANNDDLRLLEAKGFILVFPNGVTVVKDWNLNNKIRKDRFKATIYQEERNLLTLDTTGSYQLGNQMATKPHPNDNQMTTQYRIGKDSLGEDKLGKYKLGKQSVGEDKLGKQSVGEDIDQQPDSDLKIISDYFQQEVGPLSPNQFQQLSEYLTEDTFEVEVIKRAIDKAANSAKRSFGYVNGILRGWRQNGIRTLAQVEEEQRQFSGVQTKSNIPSWSNPDYQIPKGMTEEEFLADEDD